MVRKTKTLKLKKGMNKPNFIIKEEKDRIFVPIRTESGNFDMGILPKDLSDGQIFQMIQSSLKMSKGWVYIPLERLRQSRDVLDKTKI